MSRTKLPVPPHKTIIPTKWTLGMVRLVYQLALLGHTDEEMARVMDVNINTINMWKRAHPEFLKSMNEGKEVADARVAEALYKKSVGFWVDEIHVGMYRGKVIQTIIPKYYPPDSWAANRWLNVRQRSRWAEVQRVDIQHTQLNLHKFDFTGMSIEQLRFMKEIGMDQRQKALEESYVK